MARLFDDASSEFLLYAATPPVVGAPFSMACWFNSNDQSANQCLMSLGDTDAQNTYNMFLRDPGDSTLAWYIDDTDDGGGSTTAESSIQWSANTLHHACVVEAAANSHAVFLDGGNKGTSATVRTPAGIDNVAVGAAKWLGRNPDLPMSGLIAEAAIWDIALSDAEVAQLALGYSPLMIRPDALVAYWPLGGIYGVNSGNAANGDIDIVGGFHMDPQNTPSVADHPTTLIYPRGGIVVPGAAGAPPATNRRRRLLLAG